jgi:hypothetical protein
MVLSILGLFVFQALDGIAVDPVMPVVFGLIGLAAIGLVVVGLRSPRATDQARVAGRHSASAGRAA